MSAFSQKKNIQIAVKLQDTTFDEIKQICGKEDRPVGYVARELMIRGLAAYREDGQLRDARSPNTAEDAVMIGIRQAIPKSNVVATIHSGQPTKADVRRMIEQPEIDEIERLIDATDQTARFAAVPLEGDSLRELGILDGDIAIMRITSDYENDKLGIWQTPHGRTAKFAYYDFDNSVVLHNEHGWRQMWESRDIRLLGLVSRIERDFE